MTEYKKGDKVVVEIEENHPGYSFVKCGNSVGHVLDNKEILGKLEDFQPVEEKIKFTIEEKREFDRLKKDCVSLSYVLSTISYLNDKYINLYKKLFEDTDTNRKNQVQLEFAKAWEEPSRIEIVSGETVRTVQVGGRNLLERDGEYLLVNHFYITDERYYFTKSEVERISKLEQFKYVDLVGAWEDGE